MKARAMILALNVAVLVATSPKPYMAEDATEPVQVRLAPDDRTLSVQARVEGSEEAEWLTLYVSFDGTNLSSANGTVVLRDLDEGLTSTAPIEAESDASFAVQAPRFRGSATFFDLTLELAGEAELEGELSLSASAASVDEDVSVEIVEWSVR